MKFQRWSIPQPQTAAIDTLMEAGYSYLVSSVLACRGGENAEGAREFLQQETVQTMQNMQVAQLWQHR